MKGKFSRHHHQMSWRSRDIAGYGLLIGIGVCLGYILGAVFLSRVALSLLEIVLGMISGETIGGDMTMAGEGYRGFARICGVVGAIYIGHRLSLSQNTYYELLNLKTRHWETFAPISHLNPVVTHPFFDALWASGYVLAEILAPIVVGWFFTAIVYIGLAGSLSFFAIVPALAFGWWLSRVARVITTKLFSRDDLENEIDRAPQLINAYMNAQENKAISLRRKRFYDLPTIRTADPAQNTISTTTTTVDTKASNDDLFI